MPTNSAQTPRPTHFTKKGEATRARIVAVAAKLMFDDGVANTGIEDVYREANASSSQIYHYFGDKQGLIRAVVEYRAAGAVAHADPLNSSLDSVAALRAWAKYHVDGQRKRNFTGGCMLGSLVSQVSEVQPETRPQFAEGFSGWAGTIAAGLHAMQDRGDLEDTADPDGLATALLAALEGGLLLTQVQRDIRPLEVSMATVIDRIESLTPPESVAA
jgi:TetR/AcrR family transcriptional repressor of nem operon